MTTVPAWYRRYLRTVWLCDGTVIIAVWSVAFLGGVGGDFTRDGVAHGVVGLAMAAAWWLLLDLRGSRGRNAVGRGRAEFKRVIGATADTFGGLALASVILELHPSPAMFVAVLPLSILLLLGGRWLARRELRQQWATRPPVPAPDAKSPEATGSLS
ncbi:hypothetical protein [Granulicoccus sp. GXG6511]|uniref:hypothetical protein n=1 Tax=Granulicoccus sp. GXG6511 TaxID=3381351 RepID=UPI003D7EC6FB